MTSDCNLCSWQCLLQYVREKMSADVETLNELMKKNYSQTPPPTCALCPRLPAVAACRDCDRRVCRRCLEPATGLCWECAGFHDPPAQSTRMENPMNNWPQCYDSGGNEATCQTDHYIKVYSAAQKNKNFIQFQNNENFMQWKTTADSTEMHAIG